MKNKYQYIDFKIEGQVAWINLNRPERHNALILDMIAELSGVLDEVSKSNDILFLVLSGNGRSFCAGADLNWFYGEDLPLEQSVLKYKHLADILLQLYQLPQITIAAVRGNVFGGGIGLMAVCDFVFAEENSRFMFSEVKLGLLPATILPFVARRVSVQNLRKWILPGTLFLVPDANQAGLVDLVYQEGLLETALADFMASFSEASPMAIKSAKKLINQIAAGEVDVFDANQTARILAEALLSPDGQEGIHAFLDKRKPVWKK